MARKIPLFLCLLFFSLLACKKKEGATGPQGPQGPNGAAFKGTIAGHVIQYDPYGIRRNHDLNGVTVTLNDNTSATTDTNGYYHFDSVVSGNYNLSIRHSGFGGTMTGYIAFVKDTLIQNIKISQRPDFDLTSFAAYHNTGSAYDSLVATFPVDTRVRRWIVFASNDPSLDQEHYLLVYVASIPTNLDHGVMYIAASDLHNAGIAQGQTVYYAAYSYSAADYSSFQEVSTGKTSYTAIGNALKATAVAP